MKGYLVLADGSCYQGQLFGYLNAEPGELVFNTAMTGYQEIMTDPSYYGQIVVMTYPMIGNYGTNGKDNQNDKAMIRGLVVKEMNTDHDHWKSENSLQDYMMAQKVLGISGIDTRALTKKIRNHGTLMAQIVTSSEDIEACYEKLKVHQIKDHVANVTSKQAYHIAVNDPIGKVALLDFGVKKNIIESLLKRKIEVVVLPAASTVETILSYKPDGVLLSNGPGNPNDLTEIIKHVKAISSIKPTLGICLGHQLLALAYGGHVEKMKFGHRGGNHPVKDLVKNQIIITAQNHGYVVASDSLMSEMHVTQLNVSDQTIEGMQHKSLPIMSVQYHPEASPGPTDAAYIFDEFIQWL